MSAQSLKLKEFRSRWPSIHQINNIAQETAKTIFRLEIELEDSKAVPSRAKPDTNSNPNRQSFFSTECSARRRGIESDLGWKK